MKLPITTSPFSLQPSTMILLFSKYPIPGRVKTRLVPTLGAVRATRLHRRFAEAAIDTARASGLPVTVYASGAPLRRFRAWLGDGVRYERQCHGDLGQRMQEAFATAFRRGASKALAIGADVPGLTTEILRDAVCALDSSDVVLGPATDGGYYLIGFRQPRPMLFRDIAWGSDQVLPQTRKALAASGLSFHELPALSDVDRPEDLDCVANDPRFSDALDVTPRLSVIIPTLNEETAIAATLASAQDGRAIEVIVADGGSTDNTREIAAASGAKVLNVTGGRSAQMNAGAAGASANRLLFLHADTQLPQGYKTAIHAALDDPSVALGAFRFKTNGTTPAMRIVEWGTNFRSRILRWPYGDQGLFLERRVFDAVGYFPDRTIMEDFELVRLLRQRGRVLTLPLAVNTSARRWRKYGVLRVWTINQLMLAGYWVGLSDTRLARVYGCGTWR